MRGLVHSSCGGGTGWSDEDLAGLTGNHHIKCESCGETAIIHLAQGQTIADLKKQEEDLDMSCLEDLDMSLDSEESDDLTDLKF